MVDNVTLNAGAGGDAIATEDIGGIEYQRVKLVDGTATSTTPLEGGAGTEANALRVTVATDSTGVLSVDDNGGSLTVDGTVTANLSATDNAVLDSIVAAQLPDGHNVTVDNASLTVDLGANNDVTVTGTVDLGAVDNAVLDSIAAAQLPDGHNVTVDNASLTVDLGANNDVTVTGTVDLGATDNAVLDTIATNTGAAIAAGSNTIGEITIGAATTAAGDLGKAIDVAAGASDVGIAALAIRDDALTTLTPIDGDYVPLRVGSTGALHVTGGGGGTEYTEDVATPNPIVGTATMMERDDVLSTLTPIAGDWVGQRCDSQGALWVNVVNADGTNAVDVASGGSDTGVPMLAVRDDTLTTLTPIDGDYTQLRVSSTGQLHVTGGGGGTQYNIDTVAGAAATTTMAGVVRDDALTTLTEADGDVSILRVSSTGALHVTGGGGGTEYVVNAAAPADPTGTASLMERDDALSALTEIAGDWSNMRCDANGALWTAVNNTVTVDGSAVTQPVSGTVTANLSATDNAVLDVIEVNTSYGDSVGGGTEAAALRVTIANNSTGLVSIDDGGGAITVDGTVTANLSATDNAVLDAIVAAQLPDGHNVTVDNASLTVDLGANNDVTIDAGAVTSLALIDNPIVAHDAVATGSTGVNMSGARATNSVEGITQVANADATRIQADLNGVLISRPHTTLEEILSARVADTGGTSTAFAGFGAGGAGIHNYVTSIHVYNSSATSGTVDIRDGTAGAVIYTCAAPTLGGMTIAFPVPLRGAENTALAYDVSGALSTVYINIIGFQAQG